ncbi:MAG: hypothetical protein WC080_01205 [Patescibacteria group bacterium]
MTKSWRILLEGFEALEEKVHHALFEVAAAQEDADAGWDSWLEWEELAKQVRRAAHARDLSIDEFDSLCRTARRYQNKRVHDLCVALEIESFAEEDGTMIWEQFCALVGKLEHLAPSP